MSKQRKPRDANRRGDPSEPQALADHSQDPPAFPVVGLGASAGGLEALRQLFAHLPADSGMAFVVIQHLDPDRPSMLTSVLEGVTPLRVVEARSGMRAEPNRVHVIPSNADLAIEQGVLRLIPRKLTGRLHLPVDSFFQALAADCQDRAIGVVLSGSGADGTEGLRAIKAEGGIAMAQDPDSAQFRSMPESAIAAGVADFRDTPEAIAHELERLSHHPYVAAQGRIEPDSEEPEPDLEERLAAVFAILREQVGMDFGGYRRTTVLRRIERRMALRSTRSLEEYASALRDDPGEARALARDVLIHVTSFFRDTEAFLALQERVFRELAQRKGEGGSIRIWIPGCSTGEEVYSLAICLLESLDTLPDTLSIKIFGTDISDDAVEAARIGLYTETALTGVSAERLSRFFDRVEGGHQIGKRVRDLCIFVKHDLTRDPPFGKLDLISCRNVLIYFEVELQRRVIPMLHSCLNKQGHLFLGQSETIAGFRDLFTTVDKEHRIFLKTGDSPRLAYPFPAAREAEVKLSEGKLAVRRQPAREAQRQADHFLLARYAPPGVVVNDRLEVIQFRGRTGAYLEQPPGQPQANLLRMAREDLVVHLHEAFERAKSRSETVRQVGLRVQVGSEVRFVDLDVVPLALLSDSSEHYFLVLFDESRAPAAAREPHSVQPVDAEATAETAAETDRLKAELTATKDYLQSLISEHETTTDELAATNEEMVAANEELQSTNEELQSAKEELQSTNEELSTLNDQLRSRNQELDQVASDLVNVLSSVEIPVVIVDLGLRVRRFTPTVSDIASFIPEDVGRPIDDLKLKLQVDDLASRIRAVLDGMSPADWEVQGHDGRWFRMQIRPYRTADHRLDGAVISFVDVDVLKHARREAESARDYARSIVETVTTALVVLDSGLCVLSANAAFCQKFAVSSEAAEGRCLFELDSDVWDVPALRRALEESLAEHTRFNALEIATELPDLGRRILSLTGRPLLWDSGAPRMLLAIDDVTDLRALEAELARLLASERQARLEAEQANRAKDLFLATLSHELRTPLSTMLMSAQLLLRVESRDPRIQRASASIERAAQAQARLVDDLLDVSRIVSGKLLLDQGPVDLEALVQSAVDVARPSAQAKALELDLVIDGAIGVVYGDEMRLHQVLNNLLSNAIKFTPRGGRVSVRLERVGEEARLSVTDTGMGISPEVLPHLFSRFVQADGAVSRVHGGLGLGLSIVRHLVEAHGGSVQAESQGEGKGSTFRVTLPLGGAGATTVAATASVPVRRIEGLRVLLVDDDDDAREAYAAMLAELGTEVRAEASAAAGVAALEHFRAQVILADVAMPGEDGYHFIQNVRRLAPERGGRVPAAALTALVSDEDRQRALQSGFQLHVPKPIDSSRLATVVSMLAHWK